MARFNLKFLLIACMAAILPCGAAMAQCFTLGATASPATIIAGGTSQLQAVVNGGANQYYTGYSPLQSVTLNDLSTATGQGQLSPGDDGFSNVFLPFNFNYFGRNYGQLNIGYNGVVQFSGGDNTPSPSSITAAPFMPSYSCPGVVALFLTDLTTNFGGSISYGTIGTAPNRKFVVYFDHVQVFDTSGGATGNNTGQIVLYEGSNNIDLLITSSTGISGYNPNRAIGIQGFDMNAYPVNGRNGGVYEITSPEGYRFSPITYSWSGDNTLSSTTSANPTVSPTVTQVYTVTAHFNSCVLTQPVTVTVGGAGTITGLNYVCAGTTLQLYDTTGTPGGVWSSTFGSKATVSQSGVVTGLTQGVDTIKYSVGGTQASYTITIYNPPTISAGADVNICPGGNTTLTATGNASFSWSPATGLSCTGCASPTAHPTATTSYVLKGIKNTCVSRDTVVVTVIPFPNAGTITGALSASVGGSITLSDVTANGSGTWSSANTSTATVNASGVVTDVAAGIDTIKYTVTNSCGTAAATKAVTFGTAGIINGPVYMCTGATTAYTTTGTPGGVWSSKYTMKATIDQNGVATGVGQGTDTIIYTFGSLVAKMKVVVYDAPVINAGNDATICQGTSATLTATGGTSYVWSPATGLSCTACAGTSAQPTATTTYVVTGTRTGCSTTDTIVVNVNPLPNAGTITGASSAAPGGTINLANSTADAGGTWSSMYTNIATVSASGVVSDVTAGTDTIKYTVSNSCGTAVAKKAATFANAGAISGATYVCAGATITLTDVTATQGGVWSSSFATKATVNQSGVVTGLAQGVDTIYYSNGSVVDKYKITVYAAPAVSAGSDQGICTNSSTEIDATGATTYSWSPTTGLSCTNCANPTASPATTTTYIVTGTKNSCTATDTVLISVSAPASSGYVTGPHHVQRNHTITLVDSAGTPGGTWHSSNTNYVTVDQNGVVTGVGIGQAFISYHVNSDCFDPMIPPLFQVTSDDGSFRMAGATAVTNINGNDVNLQVYPNPVHGELNIELDASNEDVLVTLADIAGRQVAGIASVKQASGAQHFVYNAAGLARGIYYLNVAVDNKVTTHKVVLQ